MFACSSVRVPRRGDCLLHVLNGDATYAALRPLALPGRALVWRDATLEGPVPNGLASDADWRERARWLADHTGMLERGYLEGALAFRRDLARALARSEEAVLWFEEDLFCQLPLCYLLATLPAGAKASVICPDEKLGPSPPDVLARRFDERVPADAGLVDAARRVWRAYCAADPREVIALANAATDLPARPNWRRAMKLHLGRFPAPRDGLSSVQRAVLNDLVGEGAGPVAFPDQFARLNKTPLFQQLGLGDHDVALEWWRLAACADPLVQLAGAAHDLRPGTIEACARWSATLTATGARVLAGKMDHASRNVPDLWLGGVHQRAGNVWRYDEAKGELLL